MSYMIRNTVQKKIFPGEAYHASPGSRYFLATCYFKPKIDLLKTWHIIYQSTQNFMLISKMYTFMPLFWIFLDLQRCEVIKCIENCEIGQNGVKIERKNALRRYKINFMFCVTRKNRRPATRFISIIFVHPAGNWSCICRWIQREMT